jgi:hypothetical protein
MRVSGILDRMSQREPYGDNLRRNAIFLLSPANASGIRGKRLLGADGNSLLAERLRGPGAPVGEVYQFISSLYFRGKLAYARQFTSPPPGAAGVHIITGAGLMLPETPVTLAELQRISATAIDADNSVYRLSLDRDLLLLRQLVGCETDVILLGSIATRKYLTPLLAVFGERLLFPKDFISRGDMSRGSLLLRCCSTMCALEYLPAAGLAFTSKKSRASSGPPLSRPPLIRISKFCSIRRLRCRQAEISKRWSRLAG